MIDYNSSNSNCKHTKCSILQIWGAIYHICLIGLFPLVCSKLRFQIVSENWMPFIIILHLLYKFFFIKIFHGLNTIHYVFRFKTSRLTRLVLILKDCQSCMVALVSFEGIFFFKFIVIFHFWIGQY